MKKLIAAGLGLGAAVIAPAEASSGHHMETMRTMHANQQGPVVRMKSMHSGHWQNHNYHRSSPVSYGCSGSSKCSGGWKAVRPHGGYGYHRSHRASHRVIDGGHHFNARYGQISRNNYYRQMGCPSGRCGSSQQFTWYIEFKPQYRQPAPQYHTQRTQAVGWQRSAHVAPHYYKRAAPPRNYHVYHAKAHGYQRPAVQQIRYQPRSVCPSVRYH